MSFGPLVSGEWLVDHLAEVRVVDVRWYLGKPAGTGQAAFDQGHIPGAVHLDIDTDLSAPATTEAGRHPLPSPEHFAAALGGVGITAGAKVVAYDDSGGGQAARLWWLLHVLGQPVAVLDGGLADWPGAITTERTRTVPVDREPQPWPADRFVDADDLLDTSATIYDARTAERFARGDPEIDPRPGHVPGAHSAPWQDNLDESGRFLTPHQLRAKFAAGPAVAYCGSGVTACHDLLAMEIGGKSDTALYPGSWSQWGADESRPAETS